MLTKEANPCFAKTLCRAGRKHSPLEQCRAVLLVWSERRSMREVCREMKVSGSLLAYWQEKAMEGLIAALRPRDGREVAEKGPALSVSVKRLLEKKTAEQEGQQRAQARLAGLAAPSAVRPQPAGGGTTEG